MTVKELLLKSAPGENVGILDEGVYVPAFTGSNNKLTEEHLNKNVVNYYLDTYFTVPHLIIKVNDEHKIKPDSNDISMVPIFESMYELENSCKYGRSSELEVGKKLAFEQCIELMGCESQYKKFRQRKRKEMFDITVKELKENVKNTYEELLINYGMAVIVNEEDDSYYRYCGLISDIPSYFNQSKIIDMRQGSVNCDKDKEKEYREFWSKYCTIIVLQGGKENEA